MKAFSLYSKICFLPSLSDPSPVLTDFRRRPFVSDSVLDSLPTPSGLDTLDSSCGPWTVLHTGRRLHSPSLQDCRCGWVPLHTYIQLRNLSLCWNPGTPCMLDRRAHAGCAQIQNGSCHPLRTCRLSAKCRELGIQRKPAFQPSVLALESWELQGSHKVVPVVTPGSRKGDKQDGL